LFTGIFCSFHSFSSLIHHYQSWILFIVGGIVGALLMVWMFDWALIVLSAATGANLILQSFRMNSAMASAVFIVLFVLGIVIQARVTRPGIRRVRGQKESVPLIDKVLKVVVLNIENV
jgi:formate/nitrite transporter FocA (FNT family)